MARRRCAAVRSDAPVVRALAAWRSTAAGDRHGDRDARRARATVAPSTSRNGGCDCMLACPPRALTSSVRATLTPAPGVLEALRDADVVVLPPSNPVVSIGVILDGARHRRRASPAPEHRSSACHRSSAVRRYAEWPTPAWPPSASRPARQLSVGTTAHATAGGLLDGWLVDSRDAAVVPGLVEAGIHRWLSHC